MADKKMPLLVYRSLDGEVYLEENDQVKLFTRKQVQRLADKAAKKSPLPGARGFVFEGEGYWRYSVGGMPHNVSTGRSA